MVLYALVDGFYRVLKPEAMKQNMHEYRRADRRISDKCGDTQQWNSAEGR